MILYEIAQNFLSLTFNSFYTPKLVYFIIKLSKYVKNAHEARQNFKTLFTFFKKLGHFSVGC